VNTENADKNFQNLAFGSSYDSLGFSGVGSKLDQDAWAKVIEVSEPKSTPLNQVDFVVDLFSEHIRPCSIKWFRMSSKQFFNVPETIGATSHSIAQIVDISRI